MARKRSGTRKVRSPVVGLYYPDRQPVTMRQVMNHYTKKAFIKGVNEMVENPEEKWSQCDTFSKIIARLMEEEEVALSYTPDKKPFPEGQSRIIFVKRSRKSRSSRSSQN